MSALVDKILDAKDIPEKGRTRVSTRPKVDEAGARKIARDVLRKEVPVSQALQAAGYSEKQSLKGLDRVKQTAILRKAFREEKAKILAELAEGGPGLNPQQMEALIVNRLKDNIVRGKDTAVMSAKLLGSHKALNLWQPDYRTGVIVINAGGLTSEITNDLPPEDSCLGAGLPEEDPGDQR